MKPAKSILDKAFRYTPASKQDCAALFRRIKREQEKARQSVVMPIRRTTP